ncbi:MAG: hypothetical protein JWQ09_1140 [Segetibacter sp.]|nr:hypothetical protein [Segetibacter sp.]
MAQPAYNAISKRSNGAHLKHRNISRSGVKSFVTRITSRYSDVTVIFFYKLPSKQYVGFWSKRKGFQVP